MVTMRPPARKHATLKDVASLAGVSTATIARVLHNNGYVAGETRLIVEAALAQSGYRVNAVAQGLRRRRTFLLGHVLQSIAPNLFFATVALAVQQEAAKHGCSVILFNTQSDTAAERRAVETLLRHRVDAILFTTVTNEANVRLAVAAGVPVVQVERVGTVATLGVSVDNRPGACEAVEHLIALGHRRIAFVGLDPATPMDGQGDPAAVGLRERRSVERERLDGYLGTLAAHGIPVRNDLIALTDVYSSPERGRAVTRRLLGLPPAERPTAIFAGCDLLAVGVLQEILAQGLHVPDDLSVVGFDDTYAPNLAPPLTSVAQPMVEIGQVAARLAIGVLESNDGGDHGRQQRLSTRLIVRASTGPPGESARRP
ncbi:MAG: LacI family DNA-binding transcriptional regulator [Thermomicrobiales bacterium]